ncbi:MAG: peptidyl-prolyl cis-trans isomerase [Candidatus Korobacteraceae bacterium]
MKRQSSNPILICLAALALAFLNQATLGTAQELAVSHARSTPTSATQPALQQPTLQPSDKPVARVNSAVLTDRDLVREMYSLFPYARQHNGQIPASMEPQIRAGALKMIVFEELVYQDAVRRGVTAPPAKLQKAENDFKAQFPSPAQYREFLNSEFKGSERLLREKIARSLIIDAALKAQVDNRSAVSVAEARAYYDKNGARFEVPEAFAFQTISFLPPAKATPDNLKELHKRAEDALKKAKATKTYEEFGVLAEKISEDDYRVMMGEHKAVERSQLAPQIVQALLSMKAGDVSDVLQLEQAYTIVRLIQHVPSGKRSFNDVKDSLQKELEKKKTEELRSALDKRLRKAAKVEEL